MCYSGGRDYKPLVLDFDLESLERREAGMLEPPAGEFEPRDERRCGPSVRRIGSPAWRLLNRDAARGVSVVRCFSIGVSHDRLLLRVDGGQRVVSVGSTCGPRCVYGEGRGSRSPVSCDVKSLIVLKISSPNH